MPSLISIVRFAAVLALVLAAVCPGSSCPALEIDPAAVRQSLLVGEEPANATTPTVARQMLTTTPQRIVVAGRIGARGMEPFLKGKASFVLLEIPADDHAKKPGHDDENCPFCKKRNAASPMVAVQFLGADGQVIPLDARTLFGLQKGREVVVSGMGVFDAKLAIPIIQLTADAIHVRPPAK